MKMQGDKEAQRHIKRRKSKKTKILARKLRAVLKQKIMKRQQHCQIHYQKTVTMTYLGG